MPTRQEMLFSSALRLFNEVGFERTPTSQIAKEAGVAVGTLFHHFATKEDLVNALFLSCKQDWVAALAPAVEHVQDLRGGVQDIFFRSLDWAVRNPDKFRFIVQYHQSVHIRAGTLEAARQQFEPLLMILTRNTPPGRWKPLPLDLLVLIAWNLIATLSQQAIEHPEMMKEPLFRETAFTVLWDALT